MSTTAKCHQCPSEDDAEREVVAWGRDAPRRMAVPNLEHPVNLICPTPPSSHRLQLPSQVASELAPTHERMKVRGYR